MTALEQLTKYLRSLELRLRLLAITKGAALVALVALALHQWLILLSVGIIAVITFLKVRVTPILEKRVPGLEQRLLTVSERKNQNNPFTELLAEETLSIIRAAKDPAPAKALLPWIAAIALALALMLWLKPAQKLPAAIGIQPGNKTVRRNSSETITAQLSNFSARSVILHARYGNAAQWQAATMQPQPAGNGYQFLVAGLSDPVEYYVQADGQKSGVFTLGVKDLPIVKKLRVAIHFPDALHLPDEVDDPGGDIRAVVGSQAKVAVFSDKPLQNGTLVLENGSKVPLQNGAALLSVTENSSYHVASIENGETIRISEDFLIEGRNDEPPAVKILHPASDPHVSPIEELPVTVEAADDFGLNNLDLHYSVNGGPEQVLPLLKAKGQKQASGTTMLSLENFKLVPGDVVSMYASAKDATKTSQSDIVFAQAEPFDYSFRQAQQAGGGGSGGGDQADKISDRQKEVIAATWNQLRNKGPAGDTPKFLSGTEGKLGDQAKTLAERMGDREMSGANPQFEAFSKLMTEASSEMNTAVNSLKPAQWHDALAPEQKALQSLFRAESIFRDIQVAYGQSGGGSGSGGAQRDLARMFDLELDTSKNQYETGRSQQSSASEQQKKTDEALQRLEELAKRQKELASHPQQQAQAMQQRWEEEQLRRDAEELRRQMEQMNQSSQGQSSQAQSSQAQSSQAMKDAAQSVQRAEDEMRKAITQRDATAQQRAAEQLSQAGNAIRKSLHQQAGNSVNQMSQQAQQLAQEQRDLARRIKGMYGAAGEQSDSAEGMPQMPDPDRSQMFGYWRRRQLPDPRPQRQATQREREAATEKDQLAEQLQQLEKQMGDQARAMAGTQTDAASKVRKALSDAQQQELALRMQKNAQWIRQGYGERTYGMEDSVTAGMDQLSRELRDAQGAVKNGDNAQPADAKTAQALAQVRTLREQLETQTANNSDLRNTIQQLSGLMNGRSANDRELNGYLDSAIGALRSYANGQQGVLQARISQDATTSLQRLEIELGKRLGEQKPGGTRIGANENAPEQYRDAVAGYFRKLSK